MKKALFFVAVVAAISFVSCKKDRVCTCTSSISGSTPDVVTYTKSTKSQAKANCLNKSYTTSGITYTETCTLK